jgi:hypothetical protein
MARLRSAGEEEDLEKTELEELQAKMRPVAEYWLTELDKFVDEVAAQLPEIFCSEHPNASRDWDYFTYRSENP